MIHPVDVIDVLLSAEQVKCCSGQAVRAEVGGRSQVRGENRQATLSTDQFVGQLAQMALSLYLTGEAKAYLIQRQYCNVYPKSGDGGFDIPGTNLDAKGSLMRAGGDPLRYNLLVPPEERREGKVYILGLLHRLPKAGQVAGVHLVGWATDEMLPQHADADGLFQGKFRVRAEDLYPLMPIRWWGG